MSAPEKGQTEYMLTQLYEGMQYVLRGYRLIGKPGLRRFFIIPLIVNVLVFGLVIWFGAQQFSTLVELLLQSGGEWWEAVLRVALWMLFAAAVLVLLFFVFTIVANLLAAPFNGLLAERVEEHLTGRKAPKDSGGIGAFLREIGPSIMNELRKLVYFLIGSAAVLILAFVPVVNVAFPALWIVWTAWVLGTEYVSYQQENEGMRFADARRALSGNRFRVLGLGLGVMVALLVPLVNFLVMPAAVAGGTALWVERVRKDQKGNSILAQSR